MNHLNHLRKPLATRIAFVAAVFGLGAGFVALRPSARAAQLERKGQITEKFAAGRVVFAVSDHAIVVVATGDAKNPSQPMPVVVPIGSTYAGVLLGAVEWDTPDSASKPRQLDAEVARVAANAARRVLNPRPDELNDIEKIGVATLELLSPLADRIHDKIELGPDQPFFELLLTDYAVNYGPEVWSLQYRIRQQSAGNDYWNTRLLRPAYYQLYPPEKGQPRTLVEVQYPKRAESGLLDKLARNDPAIESIAASSAPMTIAADAIRRGTLQKTPPAPVANFLRAAFPVVSGTKGQLVMALLDDRLGFQWQIPPAQPVKPPDPSNTTQETGAPSLRKYTPPE